ncbi:MAG: carbamoyltransferase HypF [Anaerolineaceae bacterium]|nr:carbamoyltransferase HypF [Anaerolineaceae bacterium]
METVGLKIWVRGTVQGVGFRPFVYSQAARLQLTGWVRNTSSGVEIEINGSAFQVDEFMQALRSNPPPLARIDSIESQACPANGYSGFEIIASQPQPGDFLPVSPDMTICEECQRELFNPADRRYRYPFINCTNCGPRFTIIQDIPYDRPKTTMAGFKMCANCESEYQNPLDRRFHAQPTACEVCGPQLWFEANGQRLSEKEDALSTARDWLAQGKILAIKGLGGYHLACDAANQSAVAELRKRKRRSDKAFALMAFDLASVEKQCFVSPEEKEALLSRPRPVVLLERRPGSTAAAQVAPNQQTLGFMLAYTPLHLLLLEPAPGFPEILVMTSGNLSEEPIAFQDEDARQRLSGLADGFLMHNRPIFMRVDDSVVRVMHHRIYPIRRSRGYAPDPIQLSKEVPAILASGAELKNTFCLTRQNYAFLSHHIGDLENYETLQSYEEGIEHFERLFRIQPEAIACDLHPNYLSTRYAQERARQENLSLYTVQHHHAHLAACLGDNNWTSSEPVIGLSFDGTGLGSDGAIWGGEVLLGNYKSYQRVFHLAYVPLPGGDAAVHRPARMALAHLWQAGLDWEGDLPPVEELCADERTALRTQLEHHLNAPNTSSMGRLFDAASALLGVRQRANYEGQAAIELEAAASPDETGAYEFGLDNDIIDPAPLWMALLHDWRLGLPLSTLSARFHNSIVNLVLQLCRHIRQQQDISAVALSGGVWQNRYLYERSLDCLQKDGFQVLVHRHTPPNDGCIALGQALVAAATMTD